MDGITDADGKGEMGKEWEMDVGERGNGLPFPLLSESRLPDHFPITHSPARNVIAIIHDDITTLEVDAIVNAANERLRGGGGVDGAIHRAAGPGLLSELMQFDSCPTGDAVMTGGHRLPATYVIHAVGPIWRGGGHGEPALLERAYESSFARALERADIFSIAFPSISTGVYGYPKDDAARIAVSVMRRHESDFDRIIACVFSPADREIYEEALGRTV